MIVPIKQNGLWVYPARLTERVYPMTTAPKRGPVYLTDGVHDVLAEWDHARRYWRDRNSEGIGRVREFNKIGWRWCSANADWPREAT